MVGSMKGSGSRMSGKGGALKGIPMATHTMGNLESEKHMEKVYILGIMVRYMMVSGTTALNMVMASGRASLVIHTLVSGAIPRLKVTVFIIGRQATGMKVSGSSA